MRTPNMNNFNPQWTIHLVKEQTTARLDVIDALSKCTKAIWKSKAYIYFVNSKNANQPGSYW